MLVEEPWNAPASHVDLMAEDCWRRVNQKLLAKLLRESIYEEVLSVQIIEDQADGPDVYELALTSDLAYHFKARQRIWSDLAIEADSIFRVEAGAPQSAVSVSRFLIDARGHMGMSAATLATFLREVQHTLLGDLRQTVALEGQDANALLDLHPDQLQRLLDGHPKAIANKGRLGWSFTDMVAYAPEAKAMIQLYWIAVQQEECVFATSDELDQQKLLDASLDEAAKTELLACLAREKIDLDRYYLLPVHPWQWTHSILPSFTEDIAQRRLLPLGSFGDPYRPQQSLRTLANQRRPEALNVKLALSILNTSAHRGIPAKFIAAGPRLSRWIADQISADSFLARDQRVLVLSEVAGIFWRHPDYQHIEDAPYRHHEMLGAIWRESIHALIGPDERADLTATLFQMDENGRPLLDAFVEKSGLTIEAWLARLFDVVVLPLYHLLCVYGLGFIAHGQNITLVTRNYIPSRVVLKDLQGDVDLVDQPFPELDSLPDDIRAVLTKKPPEVIVHDIQTAHFVTVLRFVSNGLAEAGLLKEQVFYGILGDRLKHYMTEYPQYAERFSMFDLFKPTLPRVCINRVRFRIGYDDAAERPLPAVGSDLENPLFLAASSS